MNERKISGQKGPIRTAKRGYTVSEAADYTSLSKLFLRRAIRAGDLAVIRFGRRVVIDVAELDRVMSEGIR